MIKTLEDEEKAGIFVLGFFLGILFSVLMVLVYTTSAYIMR